MHRKKSNFLPCLSRRACFDCYKTLMALLKLHYKHRSLATNENSGYIDKTNGINSTSYNILLHAHLALTTKTCR